VTNGVTYYYAVKAVDVFNVSSALSEHAVVTPQVIESGQLIEGRFNQSLVLSSAGNPWKLGKTIISRGATLYILPGTELVFQGAYLLTIEGELQASGTAERPITIKGSGQQWQGIEWLKGATGASFNAEGISPARRCAA
jgi:hypothetical protein